MTMIRQATTQDTAAVCRIDAMILGNTSRSQELQNAIALGHCYVALSDKEVIGFAVINQSFFKQGFVQLLIVHPNYQQKGIGEDLLLFLETVCPTEKLFTSTNLSNKPMQRLCNKLKYSQSGIINNLDPNDPEIIFCKKVKKPMRS